MIALRIEVQVRDYDMWRDAFERDAGGRQRSGAQGYRIFRPVDDSGRVAVDLDFETKDKAEAFLEIMRTKVWPSPEKAPAKIGTPKTHILDLVETKTY